MSDNDIKTDYMMALLAGLGVTTIVAAILAGIGIATGTEYALVLGLGAAIVGTIVKRFVPQQSIGGALIGGVLCPLTYFLYQFILSMFGYYYEKDGEITYWILLIGSAIFGAYICYSKSED